MGFKYNPEDEGGSGGKTVESGAYKFKVDDAEEKTFKSGNNGFKLELLVDVPSMKYDVKVFENIVNVPKALWKLHELCGAIGLDYDNPPVEGWEPEHFINKTGMAEFVVGERGYLEVGKYLEQEHAKKLDQDIPF